jgi:hypothetical protein
LATLSVVFAFVFAPAGLILGHLGLAQIRRTGQRGRERALVGVTLSYVFITALVVALIVGALMPDANSAQAASQATVPPKPLLPPPTVAPANVDGLLPSLDDVKNFTGDDAPNVRLTKHQPTPDSSRGNADRSDCWDVSSMGPRRLTTSAPSWATPSPRFPTLTIPYPVEPRWSRRRVS